MNTIKLHSANIELRVSDIIQYSTEKTTDPVECIVEIRQGKQGVEVITEDEAGSLIRYTLRQLDDDFLAQRMSKVNDESEV